MSKFQKIAFALFVLLGVVLAILGYSALRSKKAPNQKAISVIPDNCIAVLTFANFSEFTNSLRNKNLLWQDLSEIKALKIFDSHIAYFDSAAVNNDYLKELLADNPVHFALFKEMKFLVAFNLKERADEKIVNEHLDRILNKKKLPYILKDGIVCLANDNSLLNDAFDNNRAKLLNNNHFIRLTNETNYNGTCIYINYNQNFLPSPSISAISLKPENMSFNGVALPDSLNFYGDPDSPAITTTDMLQHIPLLCTGFEIMTTDHNTSKQAIWWEEINAAALFNAEKQFRESIGSYIILPSMPSGDNALVTEIADTARLNEILPYMCEADTLNSKIKKLKDGKNFISSVFPFLKPFDTHCVAVLNGHLILTKSENDLQIFINSSVNGSSILDNNDFATYAAKNFDLDYHYLCYKSINSLQKEKIPLRSHISDSDEKNLKNVSHYSLTGFFKKGSFNFRLNLKYFQENVSAEPNVLWTMNSQNPVITRPYAFTNHLTKAKEISFQLKDRSLILLSATGKIIWMKKINEEIRSAIYTVDAFKNGKNQLLFNSDNFIHLIDRNGNYVQGYPVKLPAKATNHLTVFDYEKTRDYRLFIACSDNRIYNYSIWGIKQDGFKTFTATANVGLPVRYCKVGLSDYLVTADIKGKIYAFSRKGEGRIDFKNKIIENATDFELECGNSLASTQIMYFDEKNFLLNMISLTDKKEVFKTDEYADEFSHLYIDFDNNSTTDFVLITKNGYQVFDASGVRIASEKFSEDAVSSAASYFKNEVRTFISALDTTNKLIRISALEQKTEKRMTATQLPLITDLFNDGKLYAVVISERTVRCIKL